MAEGIYDWGSSGGGGSGWSWDGGGQTTTPSITSLGSQQQGATTTPSWATPTSYAGTQVTSSTGQSYAFDDIVSNVNSAYTTGKTPVLAVKSALQLGLPEAVIMQLPGVTQDIYRAGQNLISSGAFTSTATGTAADGAYTSMNTGGSTTDWNTYQARQAAGLDAYGFPAEQVAQMKANGTYIDPVLPTNPASLVGVTDGSGGSIYGSTDFTKAGTTAQTLNGTNMATAPSWLTNLQGQSAGGSGYGGTSYADPLTGQTYFSNSQLGTTGNNDYTGIGNIVGYSSTDGRPWYEGQMGQSYDLEGNTTGDPWDVPSVANDAFDYSVMALLAAIGGGAAGLWGAGTAVPEGVTAGTIGEAGWYPAAEVGMEGLAPTLSKAALDGTNAFGANSIPGAFDLATMEGMTPALTNTLSKAALDGTNSFGANSIPNALDITQLQAAAPGLESANAVNEIVKNLGVPPVVPTNTTTTPTTTPTNSGTSLPKAVPLPGTSGGSGGLNIPGLGNIDLNSLLQLLSGGISAQRQGDASDKMLEWLKSRTAITDNLYSQGSPEEQRLRQEMERKDAAAGRNSQYGTREVDLAAKIAQIKASENTKMTTGIGQWMKGAIDQNASKYSGLMAGLGNLTGGSGSGSIINLINSLFGNGGTLPGTNIPVGTDMGTLDGSNAPGGASFGSDLGYDYDTYPY